MKINDIAAYETRNLTIAYDKTTGEPLLARLTFIGPDQRPRKLRPDDAIAGYVLEARIEHDADQLLEEFINEKIKMLPEVVATRLCEQIAEHGSIIQMMRDMGMEMPEVSEPRLTDPILLSMS